MLRTAKLTNIQQTNADSDAEVLGDDDDVDVAKRHSELQEVMSSCYTHFLLSPTGLGIANSSVAMKFLCCLHALRLNIGMALEVVALVLRRLLFVTSDMGTEAGLPPLEAPPILVDPDDMSVECVEEHCDSSSPELLFGDAMAAPGVDHFAHKTLTRII